MRLQFQDVVIDVDRGEVIVGGRPVRLSPRAFAMLMALVEHAGTPVSRAELLRRVWPDTHVVPNSVSQAIGAVRRALAGARATACIQAVPGRGYVLAATVHELPAAETPAAHDRARARAWRFPRPAIVAAISVATIGLILTADSGRGRWRAVPSSESVRLTNAGGDRMATRRGDDLRQAIALYTGAIEADRQHAAAHAGLAQAHYLAGFYGVSDRRAASARAQDAASRAIALDPGLVRAYVVRASVALDVDWNLSASAVDFRRALAIDPQDALAQHWSAWWFLAASRMPEARAAIDRAVALDPFSPAAITARATFAYLARDFDDAIADSRRALQVDPRFFRAYLRLGLTELARHSDDAAIEHLLLARRLAPDVPETTSALAHAYAVTGQRELAEQLYREWEDRLPLYDRAIVLTGFGRHPQAAATLRLARDRGLLDAGLFAAEPRLESLRGEPEFQQLLHASPGAAVDPAFPDLIRPPARIPR